MATAAGGAVSSLRIKAFFLSGLPDSLVDRGGLHELGCIEPHDLRRDAGTVGNLLDAHEMVGIRAPVLEERRDAA